MSIYRLRCNVPVCVYSFLWDILGRIIKTSTEMGSFETFLENHVSFASKLHFPN